MNWRTRVSGGKAIEVCILAAALSTLAGTPAGAATFTVVNINDAGAGSLRQAVLSANAAAGADTIIFGAATFSTPQTIVLTSGEIPITGPLVIDGPATELTISGNQAGRIFMINDLDNDASSIPVTLRRLRLTQGSAGGMLWGGAIWVRNEALTLDQCVLTGNSTPNSGGAIVFSVPGGSLSASRCTFSANTAGSGGAIAAPASTSLSFADTTFSANSALAGGAMNLSHGGSLLIERCLFHLNSATLSDGGALFINHVFSTLVVRNSTITHNTTASTGGGIGLGPNQTGTLTVLNCTITNNQATNGNGGGIGRSVSTTPIIIESSIVHANTAGAEGPQIFTAGSVSATKCLIGSASGMSTFNSDAFTASQIGVDPLLDVLDNYGGLTMTRNLLMGSPAIDNGSNPARLVNDQRGEGFVRTSEGGCVGYLTDIGAYELQAPYPPCHQACCFPDDQCLMAGPVTCALIGGTAMGAGSVCSGSICAAKPCIGDIAPDGGNGTVNIDDLVAIITNWNATSGPADVNHDNIVNIDDLVAVITNWGACP